MASLTTSVGSAADVADEALEKINALQNPARKSLSQSGAPCRLFAPSLCAVSPATACSINLHHVRAVIQSCRDVARAGFTSSKYYFIYPGPSTRRPGAAPSERPCARYADTHTHTHTHIFQPTQTWLSPFFQTARRP